MDLALFMLFYASLGVCFVRQLSTPNTSVPSGFLPNLTEPHLLNETFQFTPSFSGPQISSETFWKTLIYAYGFARYRWVISGQPRYGRFEPPNRYGAELRVFAGASREIRTDILSWLLQEIAVEVGKTRRYQGFSGTIKINNSFYGTVDLNLGFPTLVDPTAIESTKNSSDNGPPIESAKMKRGSSAFSFDFSLSTIIKGGPALVVRSCEEELMLLLVSLAKIAYGIESLSKYVVQSTEGDLRVLAFPVIGRPLMEGREVLDSLVDIVEWQYQKKRQLGLFLECRAVILRKYLQYDKPTPIGSFSVNQLE